MMIETSGRSVSMMSLREVSGSSLGLIPADCSSGNVSVKIRPFERAMVMRFTGLESVERGDSSRVERAFDAEADEWKGRRIAGWGGEWL